MPDRAEASDVLVQGICRQDATTPAGAKRKCRTSNVQLSTSNVQLIGKPPAPISRRIDRDATISLEFDVERWKLDVERSSSRQDAAKGNAERSTSNFQRPTFN